MHKAQVDHHALFEHVYTHAPIGIALVSINGMWIKVNPALCLFLGYTAPELMNLSYRDITHPEDLEDNNEHFSILLDGESSVYESEKRYIHKNGSVIWVSLHVSLVRDEQNGAPLYFISHVIDISAKKAVESKLLEVEQLFTLISDHAMDIISYITPDGITQYCSPSVRDLLGYEPEEVIGKNNFQFYHPGDMKALKSKPISDHDVYTYRVRHKNGTYIWFESTTKIVRDEQGRIQLVVGIGRDITERKKYEDSLAEAQRIALLGNWEWDILNETMTVSEQVYYILDLDKQQSFRQPGDLLGLVHSKDQRQLMVKVREALKSGYLNAEFRNIHSDKSIKYLHIRGNAAYSESGQPVKMSGTIQDISERKKVELRLEESIQRYT
ncbi:MAG: hypothetical protein K0R67_1814, partial [Paenibacillus sp.]|nr:hypothetical protein [Paenibacillus sp.]